MEWKKKSWRRFTESLRIWQPRWRRSSSSVLSGIYEHANEKKKKNPDLPSSSRRECKQPYMHNFITSWWHSAKDWTRLWRRRLLWYVFFLSLCLFCWCCVEVKLRASGKLSILVWKHYWTWLWRLAPSYFFSSLKKKSETNINSSESR